MKVFQNLIIYILVLSQSSTYAQNQYCDAESMQFNFVQFMQEEDPVEKEKLINLIVSNWETYKCNYFKNPKISEAFVFGHIDFLVHELIESSKRRSRQDILDASLEAIKTFGLMHYMYSDYENGMTYLAVTSQLFYDVKNVANDIMLEKYHWLEFKRMVEDLNEEWYKYTKLEYDKLSLCYNLESESRHEELVQEVSNCLEEILGCFEKAYRPDFELPCLEMEYSLNRLMSFYTTSQCIDELPLKQ